VESFHKGLQTVPSLLLNWYETAARDLPWRVGPAARRAGRRPDPYRVWLSEVMLQQTTIPHGRRYFEAFIARWPTVEALAAAQDEDVMAAWAGLGYYARARNLIRCAREVAARGGFPRTAQALLRLPGIGPYTAGAVAAIAFDQPEPAVDGNVERVMARLMALDGDWSRQKTRIRETVASLVPGDQPGAFAEALMDLGATVCTPKRPDCAACPLTRLCAAYGDGAPETYPRKPARAAKPLRRGVCHVLLDDGAVVLQRRPPHGLLGGMLALPGTDWREEGEAVRGPATPPAPANWQRVGEVRHVFTHFALRLEVWRGDLRGPRPAGIWQPLDAVEGLPSVFDKALRLALER